MNEVKVDDRQGSDYIPCNEYFDQDKTETIVVGSTICGLGADKFVGLKEGMDLGVIYFARNICPLLYIFSFFPYWLWSLLQ